MLLCTSIFNTYSGLWLRHRHRHRHRASLPFLRLSPRDSSAVVCKLQHVHTVEGAVLCFLRCNHFIVPTLSETLYAVWINLVHFEAVTFVFISVVQQVLLHLAGFSWCSCRYAAHGLHWLRRLQYISIFILGSLFLL